MKDEYMKHSASVECALVKSGVKAEIKTMPCSTRSALDAANTLQCELAQIVKSLIFMGKESKKAILILASGVNRVSERKTAKLLGEKIVKADAAFTKKMTGFTIGGVPPCGHHSRIENILIDESLLNYDILWAAAGSPHSVFSLSPHELLTLTKGKVHAICET